MIIRKLIMHNWECFRGSHELRLGKGIYAVTASYSDDPEHSNAAGKTSLFAAIYFALTGEHRWRYEDDWITREEPDGYVGLEIGTGNYIKRSRVRGKSTQLVVTTPEGEAKGEEAQAIIERLIGFSKEDLLASCYLSQKNHSRFITGDPAERQAIISSWFDLEKIAQAEKYARSRANSLSAHATTRAAQANLLESKAKLAVSEPNETGTVWDNLREHKRSLDGALGSATAEREGLRKASEAFTQATLAQGAYQRQKTQYDAIVAKGKALKATLGDADLAALQAQLKEVEAQRDAASGAAMRDHDEVNRLKKLSSNGFSGVCPVTKGACPCPDYVSNCVESVASQLAAAKERAEASGFELGKLTNRRDELSQEIRSLQGKLAQLEVLRDQIRTMGHPEPPPDPGEAPDLTALQRLDTTIANLNRSLGSVDDALDGEVEYMAAKADAAESEKTAKQWRTAAAILGKNGAQRRVAEVILASIEKRANQMLGDAGIKLSVDISWAREGKGLADECDACTAQFSSKNEKACTKCGAKRPPKLIQKLEVELSDRSGALDDLAGIAIQLAAAEWFRVSRGAQWSVLMLDEPFGALDKTNRMAMSGHLVGMVGTWEQAFIISHTPDTALAMPNRIEVTAGPGGSTAKVL